MRAGKRENKGNRTEQENIAFNRKIIKKEKNIKVHEPLDITQDIVRNKCQSLKFCFCFNC